MVEVMVKICSKYDIKAYKDFQKYQSVKIFILGYICGSFLLATGIYFAFTYRNSYLIYIMSGVLLPVMLHVMYKFKQFEALSSPLLKYQTSQYFIFDEEQFSLEQVSRGNNFCDRYGYKELLSIVKYKNYYFIYINRAQAFIVRNEDYILGNEEELDNLFIKNLNDKFIRKERKIKKQK